MKYPHWSVTFEIDGETMTLDTRDVTMSQWRAVKQHAGVTPRSIFAGLNEWDPDAITAIVWLAAATAGTQLRWGSVVQRLDQAETLDWVDVQDRSEDEPDPTRGQGS